LLRVAVISQHLENITVKQYGLGCFIINEPTDNDILAAGDGFAEMKKLVQSNLFDVVITDEINIALHYKLISVVEIIKNKSE
jgi:cob(I)alamin adenosyltransferase